MQINLGPREPATGLRVKTSCSESWAIPSNDLVQPGPICKTYLPFYLPLPPQADTCTCVHTFTLTCSHSHVHSFLQTPCVKYFRTPPAKVLWDSTVITRGKAPVTVLVLMDHFDQQQRVFQNDLKVLGNWEWVLWAIRYLADSKINPHLLLSYRKQTYSFPLQTQRKD